MITTSGCQGQTTRLDFSGHGHGKGSTGETAMAVAFELLACILNLVASVAGQTSESSYGAFDHPVGSMPMQCQLLQG